MKVFYGFAAILVVMSASAQNVLDINGKYIDDEGSYSCTESIQNSGVSRMQFMSAINMVQDQDEAVTIHTTATGQGMTMNFGDSDNFIIDGKEHVISFDQNADNYYQKYTAVSNGNSVVFTEEGSNNNTSMKRVDTYQSQTTITLDAAGNFKKKLVGKQFTPDGRLAISCEGETSYEKF